MGRVGGERVALDAEDNAESSLRLALGSLGSTFKRKVPRQFPSLRKRCVDFRFKPVKAKPSSLCPLSPAKL